MLARAHRIVSGAELREVQRRGRKSSTPFFVIAVARGKTDDLSRWGFVVSKQVGNAVTRNRVKRKLRDLAAREISANPIGMRAVVRALPPSAEASFSELADAWTQTLRQAER